MTTLCRCRESIRRVDRTCRYIILSDAMTEGGIMLPKMCLSGKRFSVTYTLCPKNVTTLSRYNSDIHESILIIFGTNVTQKVGNQKLLCFPKMSQKL